MYIHAFDSHFYLKVTDIAFNLYTYGNSLNKVETKLKNVIFLFFNENINFNLRNLQFCKIQNFTK